ncbi:uncharacterized protein RCC_04703 [Ramularia collo-cygni]|uniref:DUF7704 domain-containing protein n=1 Tax=Ramularia collo-cygni TaxID=112498 RepID=A0A2D3UUJ5_9PEZI|nr:uncharacterized protein RCC_04703 [Ramularia collo-cygni]CZT18858.1 uncharacterized protein RCC_04703 [Ramularia collo-cygni]
MANSPTKASTTIPYLYRFLLLNVESVFAFGGVIMALTLPGAYLSSLTREAITTVDSSTEFVYTQLAGGWLHIAFCEFFILRLVDDLRVWKLMCMGILLSDALYSHSLAQALGGWSNWAVLAEWTGQDWLVAATTFPFILTRIAIVLGIGLKQEKVHGA